MKFKTLIRLGLVTLIAGTLAGCGSDGSDGSAGAPGATGPAGAAGPAGQDAVATVAVGSNTATPTSASTAAWAALVPQVTVQSVTIASTPVVNFTVKDAAGKPVVGLGNTSQSATATVPSYPNLAFALAKLVPSANGAPSKWVSYLVTTIPTKNATTGAITASVPTRPSTDNAGTLVDNGNGSYTYTFYRDITKIKDEVAAATLTAPNVAADLGDLTYDANAVHRLVIQLYGNAPGTGSNTPNAVTVTPGVAMENPANGIYDFIPAKGPVAATDPGRNVVAKENCNECHNKIGVTTPHGGRLDTKYCVVCHTDQRKYGRANVASTALAFPAVTETATVNAITGITSYSYSGGSGPRADGVTLGDFPVYIHKIHMGAELTKQNYVYAGIPFNLKEFSMLGGGVAMCTKCHDNTKAAQADNWKAAPSRLACGACHDGIDFTTGTGTTVAGATTGHIGGAKADDSLCALCHGAVDNAVYHQTENKTTHNPTVATGLVNFTYEISSVAVNATSNDVTIKFKINKDGTPVTLAAAAAGGVTNPLSGFTGAPSFLLAYALPATTTDGIASPADFNNAVTSAGVAVKQAQAVSVAIAGSTGLLNSTTAATNGSISGPDASGYYTATLIGTGSRAFPVGAKMRTVGLQGYFTQAAGTGGIATATARHTISVTKTATGDTERRKVVDAAKCANCHEWFEGHGGNRVIGVETTGNVLICAMCHVPGMATSGRGISDVAFAGYPFTAADNQKLAEWGVNKALVPNTALQLPVTTNNLKDMIHGIHAGGDRVVPFKDARDRTPSAITLLDMRRMTFPGILNQCDTCHTGTTYTNVPLNALASTYESVDAIYKATPTVASAKAALNQVNLDDTVTSPFAAACVSCHDSAAVKAHMATQGGQINVSRSTIVANGESCAVCHGAGKTVGIDVVHQ